MGQDQIEFSTDQEQAWNLISGVLESQGVDLKQKKITLPDRTASRTVAILGKAGSGKTVLVAELAKAMQASGVNIISGDYEPRMNRTARSLAILAPTNKAASVLRNRRIEATTIHRILYIPVYDPQYELIAEWLAGNRDRPKIESIPKEALDRAFDFYGKHKSIPGALAAAGLRGSDFISGWKRREDPLDIGFVDEASMLDDKQFEDLQEIFSTLVLFGDPAQLAPVNQSGFMSFDKLADDAKHALERIHRQVADNPILDLAHALADDQLGFADFERMIEETAKKDDRVVLAGRVNSDLMPRSPVLVWRNATRIRLISAFRRAYNAPTDRLISGEPLICDGIELPAKHRKKRLDLEARGLIKGAQVVFLGDGRKPGFSRLHVLGAPDPQVSAASIVKIESPDTEEPYIPFAARMGAAFVHGAACTIHKAQGSQWDTVQVFGPDLYAAAQAGRMEAGIPLWKRLAYVAITRASVRLVWVTRYKISKPEMPLHTDDLREQAHSELTFEPVEPSEG